MSARRAVGAALLGGLALGVVASGVLAWRVWREASGIREAEENLDLLATRAIVAYERDGKLCGSSLVESPDPYGYLVFVDDTPTGHETALDAEEARARVGFRCLGVTPHSVSPGKDGYVYEATRDAFVVRAFRSHLYDPEGTLPRFERRGRVIDGKIVLDPKLYRVAPGGRHFPGHA